MAYRGRGRYRRGAMNDMNDSYTQPAYTTPSNYTRSHMQQQRMESDDRHHHHQQQQIKQDYQSPQVKLEPPPEPPQQVQLPPKPMEVAPPQTQAAPPATEDGNLAESQENGDDKKPWKKKYYEDEFPSQCSLDKEYHHWVSFSSDSYRSSRSVYQKIPKKVRKKRLNAKLRNLLAPKNAMMVLQELHQDLVCATTEEMTPTGQLSYTVTIEIEGKQYKGQGLSKAAAKQTACENALKAALLDKMTQSTMKSAEMEVEPPPSENEAIDGENAAPKRKVPEDDVPWGSLASYALFKLFSEWQAQGYMLPTNPAQVKPFAPAGPQTGTLQPMKKIPADANQKHPVQLLNQLKPLCQYTDSRQGNPPNMIFTFNVTFDNQTFTGTGPNKKEAKKACAKAALISLGIQYDQ